MVSGSGNLADGGGLKDETKVENCQSGAAPWSAGDPRSPIQGVDVERTRAKRTPGQSTLILTGFDFTPSTVTVTLTSPAPRSDRNNGTFT